MRMKTTKALLFCSFTIVLLLGVVGIASAAPPVIDGLCDCGCAENGWHDVPNTPPFCYPHPRNFPRPNEEGYTPGLARWAAACLVSCLRGIPYSCLT